MKNQKVGSAQAILWILFSTFLVLGLGVLSISLYHKWDKMKREDPAQKISSIVQTGPEKGALTTEYLAELMGLSIDRPLSLHRFNCQTAQKRLLASPLIKEAKVDKIAPNTLYVDYTVRKPMAWIYEYENIALDEEGYLFPLHPFLPPKELPELYLGLFPFDSLPENSDLLCGRWGKPLMGKSVTLAFEILALTKSLPLRRLDLSQVNAPSLGSREIVLYLEEKHVQSKEGQERTFVRPILVRLSTKNYAKEIARFIQLREQELGKVKEEINLIKVVNKIHLFPLKVVDLRLDGIGFMERVLPT